MIAETPSTKDQAGTSAPDKPKRLPRVAGLDSIRFLLAAWVVLGHFGFFPLADAFPRIPHIQQVWKACGTLFNGPAAVLVFFLISGFCIHIPYHRGKALELRSYFVRREVRIAVPVFAAFAIASVLNNYHFTDVLWSLLCEEIYYTLYPFLMPLRRKYGWKPILTATAILAALAVITFQIVVPNNREYMNFPAMGLGFTWILGYPFWLLGCVLAESCDQVKEWTKPRAAIWIPRGGLWALSIVFLLTRFHHLKFHGQVLVPTISYQYTLPIFGVLAFFWLKQEISYFSTYPPSKFTETAGGASYTLYLTHKIVLPIIAVNETMTHHSVRAWVMCYVGVAIFTTGFFLLVEKPSHQLARKLGDRMDAFGKRPVVTTA